METLNNNQQATGLQTYLNENIGVNIRVKMINGEPWFSGKDVCYSIGISKYRDFYPNWMTMKGCPQIWTPSVEISKLQL